MLVKCFPVPLVRVSVEWFASPLNVVVLSLELLSPSVEPQTCMVFGLSHPSNITPGGRRRVEAGLRENGPPSRPHGAEGLTVNLVAVGQRSPGR